MKHDQWRVVILCDHLYSAYRIWRGVRDIPNVTYVLFVCNNTWSPFQFWLAQIYMCVFKIGVAGMIRMLWGLCRAPLGMRLHASGLGANLDSLRSLAPDIGLHAMNVIYRQEMIDCFTMGILNPHIGKLPEYRGRCVMEWSLLHGSPTGVTTFFIDAGIDTGKRILSFSEVPVTAFHDIERAKAHLFAENVRCFRESVVELVGGRESFIENDTAQGRRFYVMSDLFKGIVERMLRNA